MRHLATLAKEPGWAYGLWRSAFADVTEALGARCAVYNHRLVPVTFGGCRIEGYRALRTRAIIMDASGERALDIKGPDAGRLLDRLICRPISTMKDMRATYGLMCFEDGGLVSDGVVIRFSVDHYQYIHASAEVLSWLRAHAMGLDVEVSDPRASVYQIQGPRTLEIAETMCDGFDRASFRYFDVVRCTIDDLPVVISRTGWTGELGIEVYTTGGQAEGTRLWRAAERAGEAFGIMPVGLDVLDMRRIEAGIMNYSSDIDATLNPIQAGLGAFVGNSHTDYIGAEAIAVADNWVRVRGLFCSRDEPLQDTALRLDGRVVGRVTAAAWSPTLHGGTALIRLFEDLVPGTTVETQTRNYGRCEATIQTLPMFDPEGEIPRGKADIPFTG